MHLAKAKNAAVSNDRETMEQELRAATEIWPRNPALAEVSGLIFSQADVQQRALVDFDQLLSQKNYRQIFEDRARFIAATAVYPERAEELQKILEQMSLVEGAILRAQEIDRRGDSIGAWESVERAYAEFPSDSKLNMIRADLTTRAADFVSSLRKAQSLEERGQVGASLAWYLQAQQDYPPSDFAREGIDRIIPQILPDDVSLR
jgi:tetratricopeptide (TPR) repeat protein